MFSFVSILLRSRVQFRCSALFFILYNNNNSDKLLVLLGSLYSEIPTGLLLDSYWTPTGLLVLDSSILIPVESAIPCESSRNLLGLQ
jgi:hypothetical protein